MDGFEGIETAELIVSGYDCLPTYYTLYIAVGLDENSNDFSSFSLHPNPVYDQALLSFMLENEGQVKASFYLLSGQLLDEVIMNGKTGLNEMKLNTAEWPEGLIQVRIMSASGVLNSRIMHISR